LAEGWKQVAGGAEQAERVEQAEQVEQVEQVEKVEQVEQVEQAGQALIEQIGSAEQAALNVEEHPPAWAGRIDWSRIDWQAREKFHTAILPGRN